MYYFESIEEILEMLNDYNKDSTIISERFTKETTYRHGNFIAMQCPFGYTLSESIITLPTQDDTIYLQCFLDDEMGMYYYGEVELVSKSHLINTKSYIIEVG